MSPDETRKIAKEAAHEAVQETFMHFGVDVKEVESLRNFQADLQFLSRQRKGADEAGKWIKRSGIAIALSGLVWLIVEGFKHAVGK